MALFLKKIQIRNFRSIAFANLYFSEKTTVLIGKNNCGKSNILKAIYAAFAPRFIAREEDFYNKGDGQFDQTEVITIDVFLVDRDNSGAEKDLDPFWIGTYLEDFVDSSAKSIMYRVLFRWDKSLNRVVREYRILEQWSDDGNTAKTKKANLDRSVETYSRCLYQPALRDFSAELVDRKSLLTQTMFNADIPSEVQKDIELRLSEANNTILQYSSTLSDVNNTLCEAEPVIGAGSSVAVEPLARHFKDLKRGVTVAVRDSESRRFEIENCGTGINSVLSLLTIKAYSDIEIKNNRASVPDSSTFFLFCIEEPEAYQHPQAQSQILGIIGGFNGQVILSSHSPTLIAQSPFSSFVSVKMVNGCTQCLSFSQIENLNNAEDRDEIERWVLKTKGDLFYSNGVILCEGISDSDMIRVFFQKYFGHPIEYYGINVITCEGQKYAPFAKMTHELSIPCFVLSDGEPRTIKCVKQAFVFNGVQTNEDNIFCFDNGDCIERYLVRNGYSAEIIAAINKIQKPNTYEKLLEKNDVPLVKMVDGDSRCPVCGEYSKISQRVDTFGLEDDQFKLFKVMTRNGGKTLYARAIAQSIVSTSDESRRIPKKFADLFAKMKVELKI